MASQSENAFACYILMHVHTDGQTTQKHDASSIIYRMGRGITSTDKILQTVLQHSFVTLISILLHKQCTSNISLMEVFQTHVTESD